ncbi:MAG: glycosyltransferase involved in cell wall biosynthesis [Parasphingorhabdus sp.]|jgi:glycosyltransferase involved in cell wall biosynthesis|uniref:glycosyltransferase family 2 protein n=1 Tax=Parasphingorhabdus sp. TaxID=2709688 RepID=UPI0039E435E7|tara:strand:- start:9661 stop:10680 length:1020 start_codon:yes stop_codon:yes gene_type:complete
MTLGIDRQTEKGLILSVVIPCYNEQDNMEALLDRLVSVCETAVPGAYEIVLVNDGSSDQTWNMITRASDANKSIVGVNLSRNCGHQLALSAGLEICQGEEIFILDADLQDPPELLPEMRQKLAEGYDVAYGTRVHREGETWFKRFSASIFYRVLDKLSDVSIPRDTGDFRLMTRRVLNQLNAMPERFRFVRGMVSWIGFKQTAVPYRRDERFAGETHYPLQKMLRFAVDAVTSFSTVPLRLASHLGLLCSLIALTMFGWVAVNFLLGHTVPGWASLASIILLMGGVQLLVLGIFGEYLGRMYMETKQRPLYIIDQVYRQEVCENPVHQYLEDIRKLVND